MRPEIGGMPKVKVRKYAPGDLVLINENTIGMIIGGESELKDRGIFRVIVDTRDIFFRHIHKRTEQQHEGVIARDVKNLLYDHDIQRAVFSISEYYLEPYNFPSKSHKYKRGQFVKYREDMVGFVISSRTVSYDKGESFTSYLVAIDPWETKIRAEYSNQNFTMDKEQIATNIEELQYHTNQIYTIMLTDTEIKPLE